VYSIKNFWKNSPEKIKVTFLSVLGVVLALATDLDPSLLETVGVGIAIERLLDLFYVAPAQARRTESLTLQAIDLGKQLQGARKRS
jgi:hypothetical protein